MIDAEKRQTYSAALTMAASALYARPLEELTPGQLHQAVGRAVTACLAPMWEQSRKAHNAARRAYYFSAEYLMGRLVFNNLYNLGLLEETEQLLQRHHTSLRELEDIEDAALGNGGLGRLAACFLDSAATHGVPMDGYGLLYEDGLFRQKIENGFQTEEADNWRQGGEPWCLRREDQAVTVSFASQQVRAVPYDMAVTGYHTDHVCTLRLWKAEPMQEFDFASFNRWEYEQAVREKNQAEAITRVLYPNDDAQPGKQLRLKQQYLLVSASLQDMLRRYRAAHPEDEKYTGLAASCAVQLNDTHPVTAIPELVRLLEQEGLCFDEAFAIARELFHYTNHTIMAEALEQWGIDLFKGELPGVYRVIARINMRLAQELKAQGLNRPAIAQRAILSGGNIHMARLACFACRRINGVAKIHTEILKKDVLHGWYELYPEKFQNKTNGVTQRRWLGLCNPELAGLITERIGDGWLTDLTQLRRLAPELDDSAVSAFNTVKQEKKNQLCAYLRRAYGVEIDPSFVFDVQIKRLHEYKRQLLNAFSILAIYDRLKRGEIKDWHPTAFLFGAKAFPSYARAKAIIKYINELAAMIDADESMKGLLKVYFIPNYNCSLAERIVPSADISEQISTAGTEASGTGNMKLMLNGAVTLGTYDGANIEIVEQAGAENNYIFGARVEELNRIRQSYDPNEYYRKDPELRRVVDSLVDGTFSDGGSGDFAELHAALLKGASWHKPDHYFLLRDFHDYVETKQRAIADYGDRLAFGRKCLCNTAAAGPFSSDRTIAQYAAELWEL